MRIGVAVLTAWMLVFGAAASFADTIELKNGDKLEGVVLEKTDQKVVIQHMVLGRIEIARSEIKEPEEEPVKPGLFGTGVLRGWTKALSAGISGSRGKTKDTNVNADLNLSRELERHRMSYVARYFYSRGSGSTSDSAFDTRYLHDFLIPDAAWFPFLAAGYRFDARQDWYHRLTAQAGLGYEFVMTDEWEVIGRIGGGVSQTLGDNRNRGGGPDGDPNTRQPKVGDDPERTEGNALLGLQVLWNYYEGQSLSASTIYLPNLADTPEYRSESRAEWKIAVGVVEGLSFKAGTSLIYDSQEAGSRKRDIRYYGNLVYDF